ncbi:cysteine--tRNA ligase [Candidatus Uhrbacteria bacterium]|nr:cysteine--tRNA ligase [Candidatus Uhrbacteria bacterium]
MLYLFNSLTKTVEPFRPLKGRTVRMYTCGPTVYDFAHVGNLRTYVFEDVLKRVLLLNGYRVRHVMNITDVGHLTGDVDEGEDKVELAAMKQRKTAAQLATFYTRAFLKDLSRLNVLPADELPRATAYIPKQIALVRRLERRGYTYVTSDGVYFDTSKFPAYGKAFVGNFSPSTGEGEREGEGASSHARIAVNPEKRSPHDFALWKFSEPRIAHGSFTDDARITDTVRPKRQQEWPSPWGVGFPGWHLECSVMARALLGQPFDIHCGGVDHIPIHHTNEIAQSEAAYGKPLATCWLHGAFLTIDGGRMGKSEGNFVTMDELISRGFDPLSFRYLVLGAHHRSPLNFTWESLRGAQSALNRLREYCRTLPKPQERRGGVTSPPDGRSDGHRTVPTWSAEAQVMLDRLHAAFNDDLDTPRALAVLWEILRPQTSDLRPEIQSAFIAMADDVFGLGLASHLGKKVRVPRAVVALVAAREDARLRKDWARADVLRSQIQALGWSVEDAKGGPVVKRSS